jgi:hypothetical protein
LWRGMLKLACPSRVRASLPPRLPGERTSSDTDMSLPSP